VTERVLRGLAASPGVAVGRALLHGTPVAPEQPHRGAAVEAAAAVAALDGVAAELGRHAERLRADGFQPEAEILDANRLMALDPLLRGDVERLSAHATAAAALQEASDRHATLLATLDDPLLAARAADVRELGRRAAGRLSGDGSRPVGEGPFVLVADDIGPADVAELRDSDGSIVAVALARGAATSHAAIMARSLGLPMLVGAGEEILDVAPEIPVVVDGDIGHAYLDPTRERVEWARERVARLARERVQHARDRALPPVTTDGQWVTLLANAATTAEVRAAVEMQADGVGLLRTELAFLEASAWPTEDDHVAALEPLLALLRGLVATVRVLDFGSDKTPPFLAGVETRGIELLLEHPDALAAQLRAILRVAGGTELRLLLPLVESADHVRNVRRLLRAAAADVGWTASTPPIGAMVETPLAAERAREIAVEADFLSIGTNDLVQYTLGLDRTQPLATARSAADPRVLSLIARTVEAARDAGLTVEVCGEAASVPDVATLFVGLGVAELSVAPARIDELRTTVRVTSAAAAAAAAAAVLSGESGNEEGEVLGGLGGVVA
jgi:phosphoenolpyruvate-protein kinase (PTS system EI component)